MGTKQKKHSDELERLLSEFPSWIKYAQAGIVAFILLVMAWLFL